MMRPQCFLALAVLLTAVLYHYGYLDSTIDSLKTRWGKAKHDHKTKSNDLATAVAY
jgi:hypothetical protein